VTELRGMAMQGAVPPEQLSAIAMAKSMVTGISATASAPIAERDEGRRLEYVARAARPSIFRAPIRS
jgi:NAD+ diphosphatase